METARRWAQESFGRAPLGDSRRTRRLVSMMSSAATHPGGRIGGVFRRASERQAAYDFVEHEDVSAAAVLGSMGDACMRRCNEHNRVLVVMDGTSLTLKDAAQLKGFGHVGSIRQGARGLKVMNTLALTPTGEVLGVPAQHYWVRSERVRRRAYRPKEERESAHWRATLDEVTERAERLAPNTKLHLITDREGDAAWLLRQALSLGHELTVRAHGRRPAQLGGRRIAVRPLLNKQPALARLTVHVSASAARRERDAVLEVRAMRVPLVVRDHQTKHRTQHELTVVWARECGRILAGDRRVEWMLYTTDLAYTAVDACDVVQRYALRWRIEDLHRTWKSGACNVETMQLRSVQAATKWACMLCTVAARIERLKTLSRTDPEQPASVELTDLEIRTLLVLKRDQKKRTEVVPDGVPTLAQAVRWIADIGGYVGHKSSGPPGSIVLARGMERLTIAVEVVQTLQDQGVLKLR